MPLQTAIPNPLLVSWNWNQIQVYNRTKPTSLLPYPISLFKETEETRRPISLSMLLQLQVTISQQPFSILHVLFTFYSVEFELGTYGVLHKKALGLLMSLRWLVTKVKHFGFCSIVWSCKRLKVADLQLLGDILEFMLLDIWVTIWFLFLFKKWLRWIMWLVCKNSNLLFGCNNWVKEFKQVKHLARHQKSGLVQWISSCGLNYVGTS